MKLARILWSFASFYFLILLLVYVVVLDAPDQSGPERLEYILDHWTVYTHQFSAEFAIGAMLSLSSLIFLVRTRISAFACIAVGQLLYALAFPLVLGIYPEAETSTSLAVSQAAHSLVTAGLMISMAGFLILHWNHRILPNWLHLTAFVIAVTAFSTYTLAFLGQISHTNAQKVMILVTFLYLINGVYGIRLKEVNG